MKDRSRAMKRNICKPAGRALLTLALCWLMPLAVRAAEPLALDGTWRFALDRADVGVNEQWFTRDLTDQIKLPGALQAQGYGDEISTSTPWVLSLYDHYWFLRADFKTYAQPGKVKVPFLAQPPRHYLGPAWYQRDIIIPSDWQARRIVLTLERPHWESTVWVDQRRIGANNSLVAPHVYDLGTLAPGQHRLSIRVDNRLLMPYRPDAHSVSDSLAGSWNGIVGRIDLTTTSPVWIDDAQVFPDVQKRSALLKVKVGNMTGQAGQGTLSVVGQSTPVKWTVEGGQAEFAVALGANAQTWDEFHPVVHRLTLVLKGEQAEDQRELSFGLREFGTQGNEFVINGRKVHLRGTHHGGDFPLTGYPPTDVAYWKHIFRVNQAWGINHIRFHSFCPPEAAFTAADELGIYLQPEPGMWNEISPGTPMERMLYEETERMRRAYGNHPSYVMLSASNEPKGRWKQSLPKWAEHFRQADPRRLYTTGTGHTDREIADPQQGADYLAIHRVDQKQLRGNSAWFGRDYSESLAGISVPVATHELGQWVAYPDYDIIKKFTGYMRPGNYEIFRDSMAAHGLLAKNKDFAWASGRYQLACYKEEIEANLRTPGLGGFQLLDLHDYVGQGTALVGLLDTFWETKGYATPQEFRRFNNPTVPLARLRERVFTTADKFDVSVEVSHYGAEPIAGAVPVWRIVDARGVVVAKGQWPARPIPLGKATPLGKVTLDLSQLPAPRAYKLIVGLQGTSSENDWNFWLYPAQIEQTAPRDLLITKSWAEAETRLSAGGKVLFMPGNANLDWTNPPLAAVPVFWNRLMGPEWGRMLGTWNDTQHPALASFPTEANFDWQWAEIIRNVRAVNLDRLPHELQPIVWAIDDWNRNYKLGLLFECKVGRGRLLVSAFDVDSALDTRPVARQLRRSLLSYMASARFQPKVVVPPAALRGLMFDTRIMRKLGATVQADGEVAPNVAANAVDGDPNTFWLVGDAKKGSKHPHELTVSFNAPVAMSGLVIMPRQNHREHEGDIRAYVVSVSDDGQQWHEATRGELLSSFEPQRLQFSQTITARHLKFTALSGFGPDVTAALAELAVLYAGPKLPDTTDDAIEYQRGRTATTDIDAGTDTGPPSKAPPPKRRTRRRP